MSAIRRDLVCVCAMPWLRHLHVRTCRHRGCGESADRMHAAPLWWGSQSVSFYKISMSAPDTRYLAATAIASLARGTRLWTVRLLHDVR